MHRTFESRNPGFFEYSLYPLHTAGALSGQKIGEKNLQNVQVKAEYFGQHAPTYFERNF